MITHVEYRTVFFSSFHLISTLGVGYFDPLKMTHVREWKEYQNIHHAYNALVYIFELNWIRFREIKSMLEYNDFYT